MYFAISGITSLDRQTLRMAMCLAGLDEPGYGPGRV